MSAIVFLLDLSLNSLHSECLMLHTRFFALALLASSIYAPDLATDVSRSTSSRAGPPGEAARLRQCSMMAEVEKSADLFLVLSSYTLNTNVWRVYVVSSVDYFHPCLLSLSQAVATVTRVIERDSIDKESCLSYFHQTAKWRNLHTDPLRSVDIDPDPIHSSNIKAIGTEDHLISSKNSINTNTVSVHLTYFR
ncbi:hypothetical protein CBL_12854 [Carabus blaptoides fortunei]